MGAISSPLGAKQNCASPSAADTHNVPKSFERVGVCLSFCVVLVYVIIIRFSFLSNIGGEGKEPFGSG